MNPKFHWLKTFSQFTKGTLSYSKSSTLFGSMYTKWAACSHFWRSTCRIPLFCCCFDAEYSNGFLWNRSTIVQVSVAMVLCSHSDLSLVLLEVHHINNNAIDGWIGIHTSTIPVTLHSAIFNVFLNLIPLLLSQDLSKMERDEMAAK